MQTRNLSDFLAEVKARDPQQPEFMQAVEEVMSTLWAYIGEHPQYADFGLLERLIEPDRAIQFRVSWLDDRGDVQTNRAFRVQHNAALGPYKGGMRFHPTVNLSILKFLAFEQTFKNALTTLPMGGAKGGADFDPKGKSDSEVMRFCQALMMELYRHLGPDTDVPAGDIGVGGREVGYMTGMMKKLANHSACVFTGKGIAYGGSLIRPEATGYGLVYFVEKMLKRRKMALEGLRVAVSGSGNVAQYAIEKALEYGAKVVCVSDSRGLVYDKAGFDADKLALLMEVKNTEHGALTDYAKRAGLRHEADRTPWHIPVDVALPCATQNEIDGPAAATLVNNGVQCVAEGANMPCNLAAVDAFSSAGILYAPGKAANAGGVAVSGLEMAQNAQRVPWGREDVDGRLRFIMADIHANCVRYGEDRHGNVDYVKGANIAGFVKVADAMLAQGVY